MLVYSFILQYLFIFVSLIVIYLIFSIIIATVLAHYFIPVDYYLFCLLVSIPCLRRFAIPTGKHVYMFLTSYFYM